LPTQLPPDKEAVDKNSVVRVLRYLRAYFQERYEGAEFDSILHKRLDTYKFDEQDDVWPRRLMLAGPDRGKESLQAILDALIEVGVVVKVPGDRYLLASDKSSWFRGDDLLMVDRDGGRGGGRPPAGGDGPTEGGAGRGLREVIEHRFLLCYDKENFLRVAREALGEDDGG
jgi:hypothetical protein